MVTRDPYKEWLKIKDPNRPLNHYQLLGLKEFESDADHIAQAAMLQMSYALRHEGGPEQELARRICAELQAAEDCLTNSARKSEYDALLRQQRMAQQLLEGGRFATAAAAESDCSFDLGGEEVQSAPQQKADGDFGDIVLERPAGDDDDQASIHHEPVRDTQVANRSSSDTTKPRGSQSLRNPAPESAKPSRIPRPSSGSGSHVLKSPESGADEDDSDDEASKSNAAKQRAKRQAAAATASTIKKQEKEPKPKKAPKRERGEGEESDLPRAILVAVLGAVTIAAIWIVPRMDWGTSEETQKLIAQLDDSDPTKRIEAIQGLRQSELGADLLPLLLKKLKDDPDIKVRRAAADALASCGEDPRPVIAEVKEILAKEQDAAIKATLKWLVEQVK